MQTSTMTEADQKQPATSPLEFIQMVVTGANIAGDIPDRTLMEMAQNVKDRYDIDKESMSDWFKKMEKGLELARMTKGDKTYPFENASNIKYPLIVSAALQYNARTYPAIVPSGDPIQCAVHGEDPNGTKAQRGQRVSQYGSFQLKTQMERWEADTDKLTFIGSIVGTMFRKYWYDPATKSQKSKLCRAGTIIVNNNISDLSEAPAITEELQFYRHEVEARRRSKWFINEVIGEEDMVEDTKPMEFIEQVMRYDLDDDGYPEPYVVTMHVGSMKIMRVAAAFDLEDVSLSEEDGSILAIDTSSYYVDYHFLPSFDGSFMGIGLGALLGDISETVNTIINQIMDSGHYSTMGGGFIGAKDFRVKGGALRMAPGEWKQVAARGNDIRASMVPLSFPQPSAVMFQMLGMMIDASKELSSTSNIMTGDAGSANMPVGTVMALIEQGMQVFTASYKRIYRSLKKEFALLFKMNAQYLKPEDYSAFFDMLDPQTGQTIQLNPAEDFNLSDMDVTPVADHKSVTDMQKMGRAQMLMQLAESGLVDRAAAMKRVLEAASIENIDELIPEPTQQDQMIAEMQQYSMQLDLRMKAATIDKDMAAATASMAKAGKDIASAESEEEGRQMMAYMNELRAIKEMIDIGQQQFNQGQPRGMAGPPRNAPPAGPAPQAGIVGQGGPARPVLG